MAYLLSALVGLTLALMVLRIRAAWNRRAVVDAPTTLRSWEPPDRPDYWAFYPPDRVDGSYVNHNAKPVDFDHPNHHAAQFPCLGCVREQGPLGPQCPTHTLGLTMHGHRKHHEPVDFAPGPFRSPVRIPLDDDTEPSLPVFDPKA